MPEIYDVAITVKSQQGCCVLNHKVGDRWVMQDTTPGGICSGAFYAMYPDIWMLRCGGVSPYGSDVDTLTVNCPDQHNPVVFELKRIRKGQ